MKNIRPLLAVALAVSLAGCSGCSDTPYKRIATAYHTLDLFKALVEDFDGAVTKYAAAKQTECLKTHRPKTKEFDACVMPAVRLLRAWTGKKNGKPTGKGVLPAIQSTQRAAAIELKAVLAYIKSHEAECGKKDAPKNCTGDWQGLLKPSVCALMEIIDRAVKLGAYDVTTNRTYLMVKAAIAGFTCNR